jgi:23S rRNA U2552 (ribose-2'-O)-methylase RlmE/FtsJ
MTFYLKLDENIVENNIQNIQLNIINIEKNLIFKDLYKYVKNEKEKIDKLENTDIWDKMKKIGNPYELIYTTYNKKRKNDSISSYTPISRSFFKMWEIYYNFNFFKYFQSNEKLYFSHLAEGPGGFMEATYNYRKNRNINSNDEYYCITLKPTNEYIPDFIKLKKIFTDNLNIKLEYGNLYILEDVKKYIKYFSNNKAHIVTADGGFDYSSDFNGQEINSCQIIYSECIVALNILRKHGCFICKIFDIFSITMIQILFLIFNSFEEVYFYKPETSRPANSEKYLICLYYKDNLTEKDKESLLNNIEKWYELTKNLSNTDSVYFKNIKINNLFIHNLYQYNKKYINSQMFFLNNTLELAQTKLEKEKYYEIIQNQVLKAMDWCLKYNIEINKNSIYYKKNNNIDDIIL